MWTFSDLLETCVWGGFLQLDSVTLICHGLRHWLLFVGRVGCFHGFAVMSDVTSSIFVVSRLPFLPLGFFFLRIMFSKGLRLCQYYKVTSYRWLVWTWCQQHWRNRLAFQDGRMHRGPSLASTQLCRLFICVSSLPADPTVCYFIMLLPANHIPQDSLLAGSALRAVRRRCQQKIRKGRRDATLPFLLAVSPEVTSFLDTLSLAFPASF